MQDSYKMENAELLKQNAEAVAREKGAFERLESSVSVAQ